jgi:hypothetical protein
LAVKRCHRDGAAAVPKQRSSETRPTPSVTADRDKCLETAARFHHTYARHLSIAGDWESSREQIRAAIAAWPGIRPTLVDDPELEALWGE